MNGDAPDGVRDRQVRQLLDGDRNGVAGDDYRRSFDVLPGDIGGNGVVNASTWPR